MGEDQVRRNIEESRYELRMRNDVAIAAYREQGDTIIFTRTEVPQALEGCGVASRLIAGALDDVRRRNLKIIPECPFVVRYVQRRRETQDLLAE